MRNFSYENRHFINISRGELARTSGRERERERDRERQRETEREIGRASCRERVSSPV